MTYEEIVEFMRKNLTKTGAKTIKNNIAVEFDIYGEGEGAFYVAVNDGALAVEPYEYYDRDAKVIITADELVKIVKSEKTPQESFEDGILMLEGDVEAATELLKLVTKKPAVKKTADKPAEKKPATKKAASSAKAKKAVKVEKTIVEKAKDSKSPVKKEIKK